MVAEDSKDVKEKGDGEAVKGVDEKGRHDDRASWNYVGPYTKILYALASCAVYSHRATRRFQIKVMEVPPAKIRQNGA
jgi:hypothetical protein